MTTSNSNDNTSILKLTSCKKPASDRSLKSLFTHCRIYITIKKTCSGLHRKSSERIYDATFDGMLQKCAD